MLILNGDDVRRLLPMAAAVDRMAEALAALARGTAGVPLRPLMWLPDRRGLLGMMPAWDGGAGVMGIKVVSVMPGNHGTAYDAHQGGVLLFEVEHGVPVALVDASSITAVRTAAVSAVATRVLAREDAADLALLGSGIQATTHLDAMRAVRPIRRVRVWSRTPAHAARFAEREAGRTGIEIRAVADAADAVRDADLVCTTTASRTPVLYGEWLAPGTHVNAVGASTGTARELDGAAVARARLFVDRLESARHEAGDYLLALADGAIAETHIVAELGQVLTGECAGRTNSDEITLFKSVGLGIEDVAAAELVWREAVRQGIGTNVSLAGAHA